MKLAIKLIAIPLGVILTLIIFVIVSDYKPAMELVLETHNKTEHDLALKEEYDITIFNIGYGGLDAEQDFFMDGGSGSKSTSIEKTIDNIDKAIAFFKERDSDVYLIQEVDVDSSRTYHFNERDYITEALADYNWSSAIYYKVPFVPVPVEAPLAKVHMELLTLSKGEIEASTRYHLPNESKIPDKYFLLDRCMFESFIPLENGKTLIVLNVHLSAYDSNGSVKKAQLEWIEAYIAAADLDNNYYIFGGDWNLVLKDLSDTAKEELRDFWIEKPKDFKMNGFQWQYDERVNTVRELDKPYIKGQNYEQVIDGFIVSPNLEVLSVTSHDLDFDYSDHNPVSIKVKLKDL